MAWGNSVSVLLHVYMLLWDDSDLSIDGTKGSLLHEWSRLSMFNNPVFLRQPLLIFHISRHPLLYNFIYNFSIIIILFSWSNLI